MRVNGLWFASLIISLAAVSLGITVRGWLQEYLTFDGPNPQERLRARKYRAGMLNKWKVFEIADTLPVLLQISLGLFLIGLCLFTASLDGPMGLTTTPLVSSWAFFLIATTLSPIFFPTCPYKMPLVMSTMRFMRVHVGMKARGGISFALAHMTRVARKFWMQEHRLAVDDIGDHDILLSVDSLMADDSLLPVIWGAFKQRADPSQLLEFIIALIINRIGTEGNCLRLPRLLMIPDLSSIPRQTWNTFMEMLVEVVNSHGGEEPLILSTHDWLHKTMLLLISSSPYPLPKPSLECLANFLDIPLADWSVVARSMIAWMAPKSPGEQVMFHPLYSRLLPLYDTPELQNRASLYPINIIYAIALCPYASQSSDTMGSVDSLYALLTQEPAIFNNANAQPILADMWKLNLAAIDYAPSAEGADESFAILLAYANQMAKQRDALTVLSAAWETSQWHHRALHCILRLPESQLEAGPPRDALLQLGLEAFLASAKRSTMICHSIEVADAINRERYDLTSTAIDTIRFCALHLRIYTNNVTILQQSSQRNVGLLDAQVDADLWATLWDKTADAIYRYRQTESWTRTKQTHWTNGLPPILPVEILNDDRRLAGECLTSIESYGRDTDSMERGQAIPDKLVSALGCFVLPEDVPKYPQLAQLREQEQSGADSAEVAEQVDSDPHTRPMSEARPVPGRSQSSPSLRSEEPCQEYSLESPESSTPMHEVIEATGQTMTAAIGVADAEENATGRNLPRGNDTISASMSSPGQEVK
ncbi:hypothetical protein PsYK624_019980 [Phanerochaete sordida]|uniref:DUF6535 domain-containing protein n=1 Tax=Phanerochaete sordida TaxID=48140 RepID=A0A9P3L9F1_9APHY|nr:hypothetical protein PsYK624_019980 [Phanerochaete sordida]